ncbi:MAG: TPR repeat protein [Methylophilaceae bacterium]|jgi:TPR repeat protein
MGRMYSTGRGVLQDYVEAVKWYKLATAQGNENLFLRSAFSPAVLLLVFITLLRILLTAYL